MYFRCRATEVIAIRAAESSIAPQQKENGTGRLRCVAHARASHPINAYDILFLNDVAAITRAAEAVGVRCSLDPPAIVSTFFLGALCQLLHATISRFRSTTSVGY